MNKKIDGTLLITSLLCFLPVVFSLLVYKDLPEQIAVHWNMSGNPNSYWPKPAAALGLPVFLLILNAVTHITLDNDPKKSNSSKSLKMLGKWAIPMISIIIFPITLLIALGHDIPISMIAFVLVGVIFVVFGNYLPKTKQNYTVGIRLPWTLNSAENWNKTHRIAGYLWIIGGVIMIIGAFINTAHTMSWFYILMTILLLALVPAVYSFILYKKGI